MSQQPDPATVEIIRNYFASAATEMMRTLMRTATDTIIYEIRDFGISVYDADLNLVADSPGVIAFLGTNDFAIEVGLDDIGRENLREGDVIIMNYPYVTGMHTHDVLLFAPIFYNEEIVGYGASRAHWVDIGAKDAGYTLDSSDIHQEGLLFPPVKIYKGGAPDDELIKLIRLNSRQPNTVIGELKAQVASLRTGEERFQHLYNRYGKQTVEDAITEIIEHGRETARSAVSELPDGTWSSVEEADGPADDGSTVTLASNVTIEGTDFIVDYAGSDDPVSMPFNTARPLPIAVAQLCLKVVTTRDEDTNGGHFDPLTVNVPDDSVLNAEYPSPTFVHWYCGVLIDVVLKALSKGIPEHVPASSSSDIPNIRIFGHNPETDRNFVEMSNTGQGWGATVDNDGASAMSPLVEPLHESNPVEVVENKAPTVRVERLELIQDSGGPGKFRGGLGARRDYLFIKDGHALTVRQKTRTPNWGIEGGKSGRRGRVVIHSDANDLDERVNVYVDNNKLYPDTSGKKYCGLMRGAFMAGEVVSNQAGGGGGYGDPFDRDPERVLLDVVNGYVSKQQAWEAYGVAVTDEYEIDEETTECLRNG